MQEERSTRAERTKKAAGGRGRNASRRSSSLSQEEIARRAYEIFQRRGGSPGHETEDWLQAEKELREGRGHA